jgi:hypothetical protein
MGVHNFTKEAKSGIINICAKQKGLVLITVKQFDMIKKGKNK